MMLLPARVQSGSPASAAVISSSLSSSTRPPYSRWPGHGGGRGAGPIVWPRQATPGQDRQRPAGSRSHMMTPAEAQPAGGEPRPTRLRAAHERLGATMTGFAGWLTPLRYGSEIAEYRAVRG